MTGHNGRVDAAVIASSIRATLAADGRRTWLPDPENTRVTLMTEGAYHANFIVESGDLRTVARVVRASQWGLSAAAQLKREYAVLVDLIPAGVAPAPLELIAHAALPFMMQSYLPGRYVNHNRDLEACARSIASAHGCEPVSSAPLVDRRPPKDFFLGDSNERLNRCLPTHDNSGGLDLLKAAHDILANADLPESPMVLTHTDLIQRNLLVDQGHCWIVDWEGARFGQRSWDLAYFMSPMTLAWAEPPVTLSEREQENLFQAYGQEAHISAQTLASEVSSFMPFVLLRALSWCMEYAARPIRSESAAFREHLDLFTSTDFIAHVFRQAEVSL